MRVAVYTITKNEEQFIPRWAESCKDADYRLIVDTGSTDNTVAVAREHGCETAVISVKPWRFDLARNASLSLLPADIDLCIALDADEVLAPGWRQHIEAVAKDVTRPRYKYVWSWQADGKEGLVYNGDKIHARHNYRWVHPVHEVLQCLSQEVQGFCGLEIHHFPDPSKSRAQYLPLLELAVQERPDDDRNNFYLGRELMFVGRNAEAEKFLRRALELSTWAPERATAMRFLSRVTGNREHWLLRACAEASNRREPWVELAQFYYGRKNWLQCLSAISRALDIKEKPMEYLCEAESWGALPHDLASIASWYAGLWEPALNHSADALAINPSDSRLRANHALMLSIMGRTPVDVVIPTKSNIDGLRALVPTLLASEKVENIIIICDGEQSIESIQEFADTAKVSLAAVERGSGIHAMWNLGMSFGNTANHVVFLNDDVTINKDTVGLLASQLDAESSIGLICPNYDQRTISGTHQSVTDTCRGRYDGTGGLAGFCMMLRADLRNKWRFDERMKWWYGDDDLVNWVVQLQDKVAAISSTAFCQDNSSWTITNDPPDNFSAVVAKDAEIFNLKWSSGA